LCYCGDGSGQTHLRCRSSSETSLCHQGIKTNKAHCLSV
jgi:hypothetical protein